MLTLYTVDNAQLPYKPDNLNQRQTFVVFIDAKCISTKSRNINDILIIY